MSSHPVFFETPARFRAWLRRHAATASELVVGFYKRDSGLRSITWEESVDEALCFGWIDGVRTRIDERSYKIRFTPRRSTSVWSAINVQKVRLLQEQGRMTQAGLDAFACRNDAKSRIYAYEQVKRTELEPAQQAQFRKNRKAWTFFEAQAPNYRHRLAWYVTSAKRPETRQARLARLIEASARGVRL